MTGSSGGGDPAAAPPVERRARGARRPRSRRELAAHAATVLARLEAAYPDAHCELDYETPLELLVATILSAQCPDKRVNMVTPALFARFPTVEALAAADLG